MHKPVVEHRCRDARKTFLCNTVGRVDVARGQESHPSTAKKATAPTPDSFSVAALAAAELVGLGKARGFILAPSQVFCTLLDE